jgi:hypothetical protein
MPQNLMRNEYPGRKRLKSVFGLYLWAELYYRIINNATPLALTARQGGL